MILLPLILTLWGMFLLWLMVPCDVKWILFNEVKLKYSTVEGHQKKLMLAVKRLAEMQRSTDGRGSLRKRPPPITQQQEIMSMDSPPPDGELI